MRLPIECPECGVVGSMAPRESAEPPLFWVAKERCEKCASPLIVLYPEPKSTRSRVAELRALAVKTAQREIADD